MQNAEAQLDRTGHDLPVDIIHMAVEANFTQRATEAHTALEAFHAHRANSDYLRKLWGMHEFCTPDTAFAFFREHGDLPSLDVAASVSDVTNRDMTSEMIRRMNSHFLGVEPVFDRKTTVTINDITSVDENEYAFISVRKLIAANNDNTLELKRRKTYAVKLEDISDPEVQKALLTLKDDEISADARLLLSGLFSDVTPDYFTHIIESIYISRPKIVEDYRQLFARNIASSAITSGINEQSIY